MDFPGKEQQLFFLSGQLMGTLHGDSLETIADGNEFYRQHLRNLVECLHNVGKYAYGVGDGQISDRNLAEMNRRPPNAEV